MLKEAEMQGDTYRRYLSHAFKLFSEYYEGDFESGGASRTGSLLPLLTAAGAKKTLASLRVYTSWQLP